MGGVQLEAFILNAANAKKPVSIRHNHGIVGAVVLILKTGCVSVRHRRAECMLYLVPLWV
jgi:hypothetical protein